MIITVFKTIKFPAGISNLAASLANVDRNTLSLNKEDALKILLYTNYCNGPERKQGVVIWTKHHPHYLR